MSDLKIPATRAEMATRANYETEALLQALARAIDRQDDNIDQFARSTVVRLLSLNSVLISALGGEQYHPTEEMEQELYGYAKPIQEEASVDNGKARHG